MIFEWNSCSLSNVSIEHFMSAFHSVVFGLGSAISYSSVYPKEVDDCFVTSTGWSLAIVAAVFGLIGLILWIVATVMTHKGAKNRPRSSSKIGTELGLNNVNQSSST